MSDAGRPRLHLTARSGWINDPLALTWHPEDQGGRYHLFFQHVPESVAWAAHCSWGLATSTDLLHWQEQPVALAPADDELGAWSGCLVEGRILYTSVRLPDVERGRVRAAWPSHTGQWVPGDVVLDAPDDPAVRYFRDPFVVRDGDTWRMLVGAGLADGTACVLGYRSGDLTTWEHDGVVAARHGSETDPIGTGSIWECPQLLRVDGTDLLVLSVAGPDGPGDVVAGIGAFTDGRFEVDTWQRLTTGASYAASVFTDRDGAPGLVTWLRGVSGPGWAGAVSTPMRLTVSDGRVRLAPQPELAAHQRDWHPGARTWAMLWTPGGGEELRLLNPSGRLVADMIVSAGHVSIDIEGHRLRLPHDGTPVHVLQDGPLLEVVTSGGFAASAVLPAPLRPDGRDWQAWTLA